MFEITPEMIIYLSLIKSQDFLQLRLKNYENQFHVSNLSFILKPFFFHKQYQEDVWLILSHTINQCLEKYVTVGRYKN